jgi:hypothetical protein
MAMLPDEFLPMKYKAPVKCGGEFGVYVNMELVY